MRSSAYKGGKDLLVALQQCQQKPARSQERLGQKLAELHAAASLQSLRARMDHDHSLPARLSALAQAC